MLESVLKKSNASLLAATLTFTTPAIASETLGEVVYTPQEFQTRVEQAQLYISVDLDEQKMSVLERDSEGTFVLQYEWDISSGKQGYETPHFSGTPHPVTVLGQNGEEMEVGRMHVLWHSTIYNSAPMPNAIFFQKGGYAMHATNAVNKLGQPASHGCIRLAPKNALTLFNLVEQQMQRVTGPDGDLYRDLSNVYLRIY